LTSWQTFAKLDLPVNSAKFSRLRTGKTKSRRWTNRLPYLEETT